MTRRNLIINTRVPRFSRVAVALGLVGAVAAIWLAYQLGQIQSGYNRFEARNEYQTLLEQFEQVQADNEALGRKVAQLEMSSKINSEAYKLVESEQRALQGTILEQQEQLEFYKGIVSSPDQKAGLRIQGFELLQGNDAASYSVRLVLAQNLRSNRVINGFVEMRVEGTRDGEPVSLNLAQMAGQGQLRDRLDFSFRYFQGVRTELVLPEGFAPDRVIVKLTPKGKAAKAVQQTFDWTVRAS